MSVSPAEFRNGMRQLAAAVNVITTIHEGARAGMTATAVMSLTADPPQLGIAVNRGNASFTAIDGSGIFAVNVLPHDQADLASRFAGADGVKGEERFAKGHWGRDATGAPVLLDSAATFDCRVVQRVDFSSHVLFVGEVVSVLTVPATTPLLFMDGTWASLVRATDHDFRAYELVIRQIKDAIDSAIDSNGSPARQLYDFSKEFSEISSNSADVVREFFDREAVAPARRLDEINQIKRNIEGKLRDILSAGVASGAFVVPDPTTAAHAIIGMMNSVHRWPEGRPSLEAAALNEHVSALIAAMVRPCRNDDRPSSS